MRSAALFFALALAITPAAPPLTAAQGASTPQAEKLPPLSYACPMHPDQFGNKGDTCPICKMDLAPVRLDSVWTCATKPLAVVKDAPGRCPIDGTPLVQVTAVISWTCAGGTDESVSPGTCPDGSPMKKGYALRAHGNHNPQHGGLFFMAADNIHHLEGAYLPTGTFRMYFYDEFTKPQKIANMKAFKATLVVKDAKTGKDTPYSLVRSGAYLQAAIGKLPMPAEMYASVIFTPGAKPSRFDFTFAAYERAARRPVGDHDQRHARASARRAGVERDDHRAGRLGRHRSRARTAADSRHRAGDPRAAEVAHRSGRLADRPRHLRGDLRPGVSGERSGARPRRSQTGPDAGAPPDRRAGDRQAGGRSAYLLDAFGDIGNKQQITDAYARFVEAAKDIHSAFPQ